ncbi:MAG: hypothetical protein CMI13_00065 [Oleibacter sp.]|nr:hypothetical protein [Thalassolituus sp.]|tara:strand:+ start:3443 stop:3883 length:441 start_codon:yes stop_codon:yes gene_type:complete
MKYFLSFIAGVISTLAVGSIVFFSNTGSGPNKEVVLVPFVENALDKIDSWQVEDFKSLMTEEGFSQQSESQWIAMLEQTKQLGSMISHEQPELVNWTHFNAFNGSDRTEAIYKTVVQYENRRLSVKLTLIHKDGETKIHGIRFEDA